MAELQTGLSALQVGGTALVALATSVVLYVAGGLYSTGTLAGATLSGASLTVQGTTSYVLGNVHLGVATAADTKLEVNGTVSGSILRGVTMTGGQLNVEKVGTGSGKISLHGSAGAYFCVWDPSASNWKQASIRSGAWVINAADSSTCP